MKNTPGILSRVPFGLVLLVGLLGAPACTGGGGGGGGSAPPPDPGFSTLTASAAFGTPADGASQVQITAMLQDASGNPVRNATVVLSATGFANGLVQPGRSNGAGVATGRLTTTVGEVKQVSALVNPGPDEFTLGPIDVTFLRIRPNEYFVRESGADGNTGRSPIAAWRTIGFALTRVGPGDVLYVGAGTYGGSHVITDVATQTAPFELHGDPEGCFTGDSGPVVVDAGGAAAGFTLDGAAFVQLRGFSVTNATAAGIEVTGGTNNCGIVLCQPFENLVGINVTSGTNLVLEGNVVSSNVSHGIEIASSAGSSVVENLVYGNGGCGLFLTGTSASFFAGNNTFYRNGDDQLVEAAAGSTGSVRNNILSEGGADGLVLASGTGLVATTNLAWGHVGSDFVGAGPTPGFSADPRLVDPFGADGILGGVGALDDDFRLAGGSPAFDSGDRAARDLTLVFGGSLATFTSRSDGVMDGTSPDGDTLNLGFHYPVAMDAFASPTPYGARAAFVLPGEAVVRSRGWNRSTDTWTPTALTVGANSEVKWVEHRVSPHFYPEELSAVLVDTGTETQLVVHYWDGRKWSDAFDSFVPCNIRSANSGQRGFDIEYENVSGHALLVRSNDDENPVYRTFVDGKWSADAPVFTVPPGAGTVLWVELVPRYGSDQIAMVALTDQANIVAAIWDGSSFTVPLLVDTSVNELRDYQAFDAAWESLSGDLLIAWGYTSLIEETRFAEYDAQTGTWQTGQHFSTDAIGALTVLAADPVSDMIVAGFGEGGFDDDISIAIWDGTRFVHNVEIAPQGFPGTRGIEVGWVGSMHRAFALFRRQGVAGDFNFALWDPSGWKNQPAPDIANAGRIMQAEATGIPNEDRVAVLFLDENGSLFALDYDLVSGWVAHNNGQPLATGLDPNTPTRLFSLDFRRQ